jgi:hypothetical protein
MSHLTRFSAGTGSSSPGSGCIAGAGLVGRACSWRFDGWSYGWRPRIRVGATPASGALKNLGHRVARSTVATILKEKGIPPSYERPTSWQAFMRAHWNAFMAADYFTTEVWTVRGLITYYTVFVMAANALHARNIL